MLIRSRFHGKPEHLELLKEWLESYRPQELFDENGCLIPELAELTPKGNARLGANPHANGGLLLKDLRLPDFRDYGIEVEPGKTKAQDMIELGGYIRDIFKLNEENKNFRIFGPDEVCPTVCTKYLNIRNVTGTQKCLILMTALQETDVSWTVCSASICVKDGWKVIC